MTKKRNYVDGVEAISFLEGMVHMELFNYLPTKTQAKGQRPELEITEELIMTPQGFLRTFSAMQNLVTQLEQAGVVKKNNNAKEAEVVTPEVVKNSSPNFK
jgi:hypothetical protein